MRFLSAYVSNQNALDIAAYLGNPNVSAVPAITVAPTSVTFVATYVGSTSAIAALTVSNSGTGNLVLSSLSLGGTNAAEFRVETSSTCRAGSTLAAGASCRVNLSFRPTTTGAKSSTLTIAHNAAGATSSVPLTGSASLPPMPSITVSPAAITFPATTAGSAECCLLSHGCESGYCCIGLQRDLDGRNECKRLSNRADINLLGNGRCGA